MLELDVVSTCIVHKDRSRSAPEPMTHLHTAPPHHNATVSDSEELGSKVKMVSVVLLHRPFFYSIHES
jgi:hypothetical protein